MRQILVPTDFSLNALNAGYYAMELAKAFRSRIVLLNVYHIPNLLPSLPVELVITPDELKDDTESSLKKERKKLLDSKPYGIEIECLSRNGFTEKEINETAKAIDADLIVMGMCGKSKISEDFFGNISISVLNKTSKPLLLVPVHTVFRKPKNIMLASDGTELKTQQGIDLLKLIEQNFNSKIHIINVNQHREIYDKDEIAGKLNANLENIDQTYDFLKSENVNEEIKHLIDMNNIDMLIMFPHHHSFLSKLFHKSQTNQLAKNAEIPVLIIPVN